MILHFQAQREATITNRWIDNDQVIVLPHLDSSQTAWTNILWGTENQTHWACSCKNRSKHC